MRKSQRTTPVRSVEELGERRLQSVGVSGSNEQGVSLVLHELRHAADGGGDDRPLERHVLEQGERCPFAVGGKDGDVEARSKVGGVPTKPDERNRAVDAELMCEASQRCFFRPAAHDCHVCLMARGGEPTDGGQQQVDPLLGAEPADESDHWEVVVPPELASQLRRVGWWDDVDPVRDHRDLRAWDSLQLRHPASVLG